MSDRARSHPDDGHHGNRGRYEPPQSFHRKEIKKRDIPRSKLYREVNRAETSPLLIKVYAFEQSIPQSSLSEDQKEATEIHIYTWLDSSLSDLKSVIQKVWTPIKTNKPVTFYGLHHTSGSEGRIKLLGTVAGPDEIEDVIPSNLGGSGFHHGDSLFITIGS